MMSTHLKLFPRSSSKLKAHKCRDKDSKEMGLIDHQVISWIEHHKAYKINHRKSW